MFFIKIWNVWFISLMININWNITGHTIFWIVKILICSWVIFNMSFYLIFFKRWLRIKSWTSMTNLMWTWLSIKHIASFRNRILNFIFSLIISLSLIQFIFFLFYLHEFFLFIFFFFLLHFFDKLLLFIFNLSKWYLLELIFFLRYIRFYLWQTNCKFLGFSKNCIKL